MGMQVYVGQASAKIRSERFFIKWHRIERHMLKMLYLIIILVYEEI
jgi:hypothetical protein